MQNTKRIPVPTSALLWLVALWLVVSIAASILLPQFAGAVEAWAALGALLLLVALADWVSGYLRLCAFQGAPAFSLERRVAHTVPVGVAAAVTLKVTNHRPTAANLIIYDSHPQNGVATELPIAAALPPQRFGIYTYAFTPEARGDISFGRAFARLVSPLRLWQLPFTFGEENKVRVFPNYAAVTRYALLSVDHRLSQIGVLKRRRRGEGMDFHQLRDYREGDSPRAIDWKATARRVKLISREYQDERDQQVFFLLDCSRRMNAKDDALSHFDHTLNAILLLTFVAIRQGDATGLMTFGATEDRFIAPKKSQATVSRFLNTLYPLEPTLKTPDYYQAALELGRRLNKRALIIVISNVRDEDEDGLDAAMLQLKRRHLVLFANLKEAAVEEAAKPEKITANNGGKHRFNASTLIDFAAATKYAADREATLARMRARGVKLIDVVPEKLPIALVNRYLDMKQSGAL